MILDTICAVALIANILPACAPPSSAAVGYIEGEYVNVAPIEVARVANEYVRRGDRLKAGDRIATLETTDAEIAVRNAEAALAQADADLANILYGRRPEEIAAIDADLKAAEVQQDDAERTLNRRKDLNSRGFASQADLDRPRRPTTSPPRGCASSPPISRWRSSRRATRRSFPRATRSRRRRPRSTTRAGGSSSASSSRPRQAMSPTSSAASATSPARRRRSFRSFPKTRSR